MTKPYKEPVKEEMTFEYPESAVRLRNERFEKLESELAESKKQVQELVELLEEANETVKTHAMQTYSKVSGKLAAAISDVLSKHKLK
jgi:hypothetical protein